MAFIQVNEDNPLSKKHVGFVVDESDSNEIVLYEIVRNIYRHPDMQGQMNITCLDKVFIQTYKRTNPRAATLILLEAAQRAVSRELL